MNRDESLDVVAMILNTWSGTPWTEEQMDAYARGIQTLPADLATRAVARASRELKHRPQISELVEYVRIERKLAEPEHVEHPKRDTAMPEWVQVWAWLRFTIGDFTPMPQQQGYLGNPDVMSVEQYEACRARWVEAGSPSVTAGKVLQQMGAT